MKNKEVNDTLEIKKQKVNRLKLKIKSYIPDESLFAKGTLRSFKRYQ